MASSSSTSSKVIVLMSSDKERFEVEESVLSESSMIKHMIEDVNCADVIPLPNVTSNVLAQVIEFCTHHHTDSAFGTHFAKVNHDIMFELILAANYLDINSLLDVTTQYVANVINGKSTMEEVRKSLRIRNDFTPEEEEEVRKENDWAFRDANGR